MIHKLLFLSFLLLLTCSTTPAETYIHGGSVSGTWTLAGSPYIVVDHILLEPGNNLTIEAGVEVIFQAQKKFTILGTLEAIGTQANVILFRAADPDSGWNGLRFCNQSFHPDTSRLVYCKVTECISAAYSSPADRHGGAVYCAYSDHVVFQNCLFMNNRTGDYKGVDGVDGVGGGGSTGNPGTPGGSAVTGYGGAIYLLESDVIIDQCRFVENYTGEACGGNGGNGADWYCWNWAIGGAGGLGGEAASGYGGAIYGEDSSPLIYACEFVSNATGNATGGEGGDGGDGSCEDSYADGGHAAAGGLGESGGGGAIYLVNSEAQIEDNIFQDCATGAGIGGDGGDGGDAQAWMGTRYEYGGDGGDGGDGISGSGGIIGLQDSDISLSGNLIIEGKIGSCAGGDGGDGGDCGSTSPGGVKQGGDGGSGGNAIGGDGSTILSESSTSSQSFNTVSCGLFGMIIAGAGGAAGYGVSAMGTPGVHGSEDVGGGVLVNDANSSATMHSSIIWNNADPDIIGSCTIEYSCIENGFPGTGNIDQPPQFLLAMEDDYRLQWGSPCIDSGNPDPQYNDPDGTQADMGARCYDQNRPAVTRLTLHDAPAVLPASGGELEFTIWIDNISPATQAIEFWCDITDEAGTVHGPIIGVIETDLLAGAMVGRVRTQTAPAGAPPGYYTYHSYCVVESDTSHDAYTFYKLGEIGDGLLSGWDNSGDLISITDDQYDLTFRLEGAYPNPFNPATQISFDLLMAGEVELEVFDVRGRSVRALHEAPLQAGHHTLTFNGSGLPSGIYFYRLTAGDYSGMGKMVLLK